MRIGRLVGVGDVPERKQPVGVPTGAGQPLGLETVKDDLVGAVPQVYTDPLAAQTLSRDTGGRASRERIKYPIPPFARS